MDKQSFIHHLRLIVDPYDTLQHLECDGLTRILHKILSDNEIKHTVYTGEVIHKDNAETIPIHFWIDIEDLRIDYRARMWLGETPDIPHGIFHPTNYPKIYYQGSSIKLALLPDVLFQILTRPFPTINENV